MSQDDTILHQDDVEEVIVDTLSTAEALEVITDAAADEVNTAAVEAALVGASSQVAITNVAAPSATYVEAEALAARDAINLILGVLRDSSLIPT